MRINKLGGLAIGIAAVVSMNVPSDARPPAKAGSVAKRAAAKQAAAEAAARRTADARAEAEAAERARVRAQWGLLAELPDGDYDARSMILTVRRGEGGNQVAMTLWGSMARLSYTFRRDPASGKLSYDYKDIWNSDHHDTRIAVDGSIEGMMKDDLSWPILKRDASGVINFAYAPGKKMPIGPLVPGSKGAIRLASLVSAGKVSALGASSPMSATSVSNGALASLMPQAQAPLPTPAEGIAAYRRLAGNWTNGKMLFHFHNKGDITFYSGWFDDQPQAQNVSIRVEGGVLKEGDDVLVPIAGGWFNARWRRGYFIGPDGSFAIRLGKLKNGVMLPRQESGSLIHGEWKRVSQETAENWVKSVQSAQQQKRARQQQAQSSGNSGWLGGLIMGTVAAAAGGDAGTIMGAAMKGVEMTTDNEMTRNVLAGQGDEMIQSSIDLKNQKAELERLRVAAAEETRQKQLAEERAETNRRAAENAKRVQEANARQQRIADEFAAKRAADEQRKLVEASRDSGPGGPDLSPAGKSREYKDKVVGSTSSFDIIGVNGERIHPGITPVQSGTFPPGTETVPIWGYVTGISGVSMDDARAKAFAQCAAAGKSCEEIEASNIGGNAAAFAVEVRFDTGGRRSVSKGSSRVSGQ